MTGLEGDKDQPVPSWRVTTTRQDLGCSLLFFLPPLLFLYSCVVIVLPQRCSFSLKYQIFFQVWLNIFSKCCVHVFLVGCLLGWWRLRPLPGRCWVRVVAGPQSSAHSTSPTEAGLVQPPAPSHHHPPAQPSPPDKGGNDISRNISFSLQSEKVRRM